VEAQLTVMVVIMDLRISMNMFQIQVLVSTVEVLHTDTIAIILLKMTRSINMVMEMVNVSSVV
jgi:hypothetical protein